MDKLEGKFHSMDGSIVEVELVGERRWKDRRAEKQAIKGIERRLKERRCLRNESSPSE